MLYYIVIIYTSEEIVSETTQSISKVLLLIECF